MRIEFNISTFPLFYSQTFISIQPLVSMVYLFSQHNILFTVINFLIDSL